MGFYFLRMSLLQALNHLRNLNKKPSKLAIQMHRAMVFQSLFLLQLLLLFFLTTATATAKRLHTIPRLSPIGPRVWLDHPDQILGESVREDLETFFYNQTLDHFNYRPESYDTFLQRYLINSKYWGGANACAPILVYLGAEAPIDEDLDVIGFLVDTAAEFSSLLVYVEHRYYGKSIPFGSREEALKNASTLGYFNSAQAIADYAAIIIHIKKTLQAKDSPVIVIGGSYGGMLASWFRLKYPHIALGALASSAPVLYFDDITPQYGYYALVSKDFRGASETCYQTIRKSWEEIDEVASKPDGLSILSKKFKTCNPLTDASELRNHLDSMYANAAQYNKPPTYPVNKVCGGIDGGGFGDDLLGRVFGGLVAYKGNRSCYVNEPTNQSETSAGWRWQSIRLILQRFASNIIFSNGLRDPYSSGGVLENISDTVVAVKTVNGSHCLDILFAKETDPEWLVAQRKTEIKIIKEWINKYYADLSRF
ncbi:PREDICTED: lysosomal Pro-X carboxypeptidase-like isoform X2 [Populus euphratica]|uniref:Lysosomal Pro-X carboxypeptidase-like isoform X2 n=1 Tax=Populus euphratica TaxID=75702 RepID=A0AAJ6X4B4_POPEU|nr:PREDICTED: lysosomal Pro-X carboxypeptidase-like isoform X2 [Populus euphratica]